MRRASRSACSARARFSARALSRTSGWSVMRPSYQRWLSSPPIWKVSLNFGPRRLTRRAPRHRPDATKLTCARLTPANPKRRWASPRSWQLTRSRALIGARDGVIVAEFFDVDKSRSIPWPAVRRLPRCSPSSRIPAASSMPLSSASRTGRSTATSTASRSRSSSTMASRSGCPKWAARSTRAMRRTTW